MLPDGQPGNQYRTRFTHKLEIGSILSNSLAAAATNSGLTTAIAVLSYEPNTEQSVTLKGRGFVGWLHLRQPRRRDGARASRAQNAGAIEVLDPIGMASRAASLNDIDLVSSKAFVFVADTDGDLETFETFDPERRALDPVARQQLGARQRRALPRA